MEFKRVQGLPRWRTQLLEGGHVAADLDEGALAVAALGQVAARAGAGGVGSRVRPAGQYK